MSWVYGWRPSLWWGSRSKRYYANKAMDPVTARRHMARTERLGSALAGYSWASLLEVGCGFGWNLDSLKRAFPDGEFVGCDFSQHQLERARSLYGDTIRFDRANARDIPYAAGRFDVAMTVTCFMHLPPNHIQQAADELVRVAARYIVVLELDRELATPDEIREQDGSRVAFWHDYDALFAPAFRLVAKEDWADFNDRVEALGLRIYARAGLAQVLADERALPRAA